MQHGKEYSHARPPTIHHISSQSAAAVLYQVFLQLCPCSKLLAVQHHAGWLHSMHMTGTGGSNWVLM